MAGAMQSHRALSYELPPAWEKGAISAIELERPPCPITATAQYQSFEAGFGSRLRPLVHVQSTGAAVALTMIN
jgi:hypothetical protein